MGRLLGCLGRVVVLLLLLLIIGVAWVGWPRLQGGLESEAEGPTGPPPTPELAEAATLRVQAAVEAGVPTVELSESEITAILLHAVGERLPRGLTPTGVGLDEGEIRIEGRWDLDRLPAPSWLERVAGLLPDEISIEVRAALLPAREGEVVLLVRRILAGGIPIPRRGYSALLPGIGEGGGEAGALPPETIRISLPREVRSIYIENDRLLVEVAR